MGGRIAYVCLSDMHLGSDRSLLTFAPPDAEPDASVVLRSLVDALRSLLEDNGGHKPVLVLNGDCFELALASDEVSATVFQRFMELVMQTGEELFSAVCFVPGNHDHHLWEAARESQYAEYLARHDPRQPIPHPLYATRMMLADERHPTSSPLLTTLLRRARRATGADEAAANEQRVSVSYPNFGVRRDDRCIVFHHGHFIEPAYKLLTTVNTQLFGGPMPRTVSALEEGNFAWIDFFWSALGRAGDPGDRVQFVYDHLRDPDSRDALAEQLAYNLARLVRNRTPLQPFEDRVQAEVIEFVLKQLSQRAEALGRRAYYGGETAVSAHDRGLEQYIEVYVNEQLRAECPSCMPSDVTFVFGHTHHPLVRLGQRYEGFERPVRVYNSGGWIHETADLQDQVGASVIVVSEELDVVAIEVYREVPSMCERYVRVAEATPAGEHTAFHEHVRAGVEGHPTWNTLVRRIAEAMPEPAQATGAV